MTIVRHRYQLTPSRDTDDLRMLESDCTRDIPNLNQTKVIASHATFP